MRIGILHPGEMGAAVASTLISSGNEVSWCSANRSSETAKRSNQNGLSQFDNFEQLCNHVEALISICPPNAAKAQAQLVAESTFSGMYCDANAISPSTSFEIAALFQGSAVEYVDGGIIGGPPTQPGTVLYLSGEKAEYLASCWNRSLLEVKCIGKEIGKASALKVCYAAYSKGTTALLTAILSLADQLEVADLLDKQWADDGFQLDQKAKKRATHVPKKAWRYAGEMREIAEAFRSKSLPDGFHLAAAEIYDDLAGFKGCAIPVELSEVLEALRKK